VAKFDKFRGEFGKLRGKANEIPRLTAEHSYISAA